LQENSAKPIPALKILFSTAFAILISYFLLSQIQLRSIPETLGRLSLSTLLIGFCLYGLFVWTKALRFRELLRLNRPVKALFPIFALHTFWGNLLPMRSGDVSYIYLMKRREQVDGTKSVASLMLASIIELILLLGLMIGTAGVLRDQISGELSYVGLFLIPTLIGLALLGLMAMVCLAPNACNRLAARCVEPLRRWNVRPLSWFLGKGLAVVDELTQIRPDRRFFTIWAYSILSLGIRFGFQCYLVREMGIAVSISALLFALAFTNVFNLLPIQSVGNFGTIEAPFAWALMRFGTPTALAVVSGFSLHLIILLYCVPLGVFGGIKKPRASE
jgi:glycosyltransferase 2 family protein